MSSSNVSSSITEGKQYVLVSAIHGRNGKKLHWVVAEKRKSDDWFLKSKPVESLCGKKASRLADSALDLPKAEMVRQPDWSYKRVESNDFFFRYDEDELYGDLWLGIYHIDPDTAEDMIKRAMAVAATLIEIPQTDEDKESFFAELEAEDNQKVARQQEHDHELDTVIAELCRDIEVEFFEPRMM